MIEYFNDDDFKRIRVDQINGSSYVIDNDEYTCITFNENDKEIVIL